MGHIETSSDPCSRYPARQPTEHENSPLNMGNDNTIQRACRNSLSIQAEKRVPTKAPVCPENVYLTRQTPHQEVTDRPLIPNHEKLVLVRERLGTLCQWTNGASQPAMALANTVKRFMKLFVPDGNGTVEWKIPVTSTSDSMDGVILTEVTKKSSEWWVNSDRIESILSLWIASIRAKRRIRNQNTEHPHWKQSQAGDSLRMNYTRIIGLNSKDDVLKRDMSWWTSWTNGQSTEHLDPGTSLEHMYPELVIGFTGPPNGLAPTHLYAGSCVRRLSLTACKKNNAMGLRCCYIRIQVQT